jgi:hypothetical protein
MTVDIGFLRLVVSTKPLNTGRAGSCNLQNRFRVLWSLGVSRETVEKGQTWDAFHAVIMMEII